MASPKATDLATFQAYLQPTDVGLSKGHEFWSAYMKSHPLKKPKDISIQEVVQDFVSQGRLSADGPVAQDIESSLKKSFLQSNKLVFAETMLLHIKLKDTLLSPFGDSDWKIYTSGRHNWVKFKARSHEDVNVKGTEVIVVGHGLQTFNPHSIVPILETFLMSNGIDTKSPNIIQAYKFSTQVSYKIPKNGTVEPGDTFLVEFQKIKKDNSTFQEMANYVEICIRQVVLRLLKEKYVKTYPEKITPLVASSNHIFLKSCPCNTFPACHGSSTFNTQQKFCPSWFS